MTCLDKCRVVAIAFLLGALVSGCTGSMTAPSGNPATPATNSPVPPAAPPAVFTLKGRVTESMPTPRTGIPGASVRISAGANAGRSVVADPYGYYTLAGVESGSTINVSADGYMSTLKTVNAESDPSDFQLMPVPRTDTHTMDGTLSSDVGTCSDGVSMKPCNIMTIAIHNAGPLDAVLTWSPSPGADLDLSLFRTNDPRPIMRSTTPGSASERISANLPAGATYELHVTYASGTSPVTYQLKVTHMN